MMGLKKKKKIWEDGILCDGRDVDFYDMVSKDGDFTAFYVM